VLQDTRTPRTFRDPEVTLKVAYAGPYAEPHRLGRTVVTREYLDSAEPTHLQTAPTESKGALLARLARKDAHEGIVWEAGDKKRLEKNTREARFLELGKKEDNIFCVPGSGLQFQIMQAKRRLAAAGQFHDKKLPDFSPHKAPSFGAPYLPPSAKAAPRSKDLSRPPMVLRHKKQESSQQMGTGIIHLTGDLQYQPRPKTVR